MTRLLTAVFLLVLMSGCAQTPAQVTATEPIFSVSIAGRPDGVARCLVDALENQMPELAFSVRGQPDRPRVQAHGGPDQGTVMVIAIDGTNAVAYVSRNLFATEAFRDRIKTATLGCDKR